MSITHAETVICGAGIVGLTLARELLARGHQDILIIDKEPQPGRHASGRNSGVLHAGIYYAPGTSRARTCMEGNRRMKAYCREKKLPLKETGKVIVTRSRAELDTLLELYRRATANGADVALVNKDELAQIEPNARTVGLALHSRDTAVVSPKRILLALLADLENSGRVRFLFNTAVTGAADGHTLLTTQGPVLFSRLINAAGAHADRVAAHFGVGGEYRLVPFKGIYKKLKSSRAVIYNGSIYPVPNITNPFLGIHFTRSVDGEVYLGPTAIPAFGRENYGLLRGMDREAPSILLRDARLFCSNAKFRAVALEEPRKYFFRHFFNDARKLVKDLQPEDVEPSTKVGIRPQLINVHTGEMVMDFKVERKGDTLHVLNSISPAFTSSMAFAAMLIADHQL